MPITHSISSDRIAQAARTALLQQGMAESSARTIASLAGTTASAINYNYGGIIQLYNTVFETALTETAAFAAQQLDELRMLPGGPSSAAFALEQTISAWTGPARHMAILFQEALAAPDTDPLLLARWVQVFARYWAAVSAHVGAGARGVDFMHGLFQSEALYALSRWRPALEQAALRDLCAHVCALIFTAPDMPSTGALDTAERMLRLASPGNANDTAQMIMLKAVDVVADLGISGLTHRAVAARCGVTAGAVAHYFRTAEDLLAAAIRGQVMILQAKNASHTPHGDANATSLSTFPEFVTHSAWNSANRQVIRGRRQLFLATIRTPDRALAGATVRFAQGATVTGIIGALVGDKGRASLHGSVLSRLISSLDVTSLGAQDPEAATRLAARAFGMALHAIEAGAEA
jgi:AcrR family transcriptional regulator